MTAEALLEDSYCVALASSSADAGNSLPAIPRIPRVGWLIIALCGLALVSASVSAVQAKLIRPQLRFEMVIPPEEVGELQEIVERFARSEGFALRDLVAESRPPVKPRFVYLLMERNNRAMRVSVHNYLNTPRILVAFYNLQSDPGFDQAVQKLRAMIDERWRGRLVPMDDSDRVATPATPTLRLELVVSPGDGDGVRKAFERFAEMEKFKITEHTWIILGQRPGERRPVSLTLTRGTTMRVRVSEYIPTRGRFVISIYDLDSDPRFEETSATLKAMLLEKWPGRLFPSAG